MIAGVAGNGRAKSLFGFVQMSVAAERHTQSVPRGRARRVDGDRVAKAGKRCADQSGVALELAESLSDRSVRREQRQSSFVSRNCFGGPAQPNAQLRVEDRQL